jgi:hypothetical protein
MLLTSICLSNVPDESPSGHLSGGPGCRAGAPPQAGPHFSQPQTPLLFMAVPQHLKLPTGSIGGYKYMVTYRVIIRHMSHERMRALMKTCQLLLAGVDTRTKS